MTEKEMDLRRIREYNHPDGSPCPVCNGSGHMQELVYYGGKLLHKGWFGNWQLWYAKAELARLRIREAVKTEEEHETENEI